jgi:type I restriction enzyme S subunit
MAKINTIPEVRFAGFTEEWVEKDFEEVFTNISNNSLSREKLNYVTGLAKNVHYGDILVKFNDVLDVKKEILPFVSDNATVEKLKYSFLKDGDIILSDAAEDETVGKCVELYNVDEEKILSGLHTIAVRPKEDFASKFLGYYMNSSFYHEQLLKLMQGTKVLSISKTAIKKTVIRNPKSKDEQKLIGNFFENIDKLIAEHQQKLEKFIILRKSMLVKVFPKNGNDLPEIRFDGFKEKWIKFNLGEVSPIRGGFAFKSNEFKKEGVPILKISNILPTGEVGGRFDFYDEQPQDENFLLPNNSAVLAMSGATTGKVSILKFKENKKVYQNQRVGYFQDKGVVDYSFISILLRSPLFSDKMKSVLVAGAQPNVSPKEINAFEFYIPNNSEEQKKIGTYFNNLDELIRNHNTQLVKLQNIKKAFLAKMFI